MLFAVPVLLLGQPVLAQYTSEQLEFFEKKIRPVLATHCYQCHSAEAPAPMGGLLVDTRDGLLKGGSRGPAVIPGDPQSSRLIQALSYTGPDLRMPPGGKLEESQIKDLMTWIRMGAPAPDERKAAPQKAETGDGDGFDPQKARQYWAFQPVRKPALPSIQNKQWPKSAIDHFILAKLEAEDLQPAPPADKRTLIRRVTFDLTGLPPTPQEIDDFLADDSPDAFEKIIERLLASPRYGERWARHWLDLVRFAETNGHEFDDDKLDAWRYRDYIIRAFNRDVPYNQFVREHIAGDLLPNKRSNPQTGQWESPVGTGFYWFGEILNSATDSIKSRADQVDNQIDVMSKTFLGLTVACARCHDHKFDPIPTADYYSLAGIMHSTDSSESVIDSPSRIAEIASCHQKIVDINGRIKLTLQPAQVRMAQQLKDYLLAAANRSAARGLNLRLLEAWRDYLAVIVKDKSHVLYGFARALDQPRPAGPFPPAELNPGEIIFEQFENLDYSGWTVSGQAFGLTPSRELPPNQPLRGYQGQGVANSFRGGSDKLVGSLTSRKFKMPKYYLHVRLAGTKLENRDLRVTLVADGYKSQNIKPEASGRFSWKTVRMTKEINRICYFEIVDRSRQGHIVVDKVVLSDSKEPPDTGEVHDRDMADLLTRQDDTSPEELAEMYQGLFIEALEGKLDRPTTERLLPSLTPTGKLEDLSRLLSTGDREGLRRLQKEREALEREIPESAFATISTDEDPRDIRIHIRGNHKNLGKEVPRRFLRVVAGEEQGPILFGSGRLQLADWVAGPQNPLTARVMANRLWKHHFAEGIVRSEDNFGQSGERPTHPELLDFVAQQFVESGWSVKAMHRMMLLSSTYQMSSRVDKKAAAADPQNKLLHYMPVRRLEAEAIRDSILAVAGTLDRKVFGPSVPPHISPYQDGRGKPVSGPLDGNGRRSIYIQVRRNFLTPMFLAFDYPLPISTIGARSVSTVPSQPLMMMNNEFIAGQAQEWARRVIQSEQEISRRIHSLYQRAFGRPAEDWELTETRDFLEAQKARYQAISKPQPELEQQVWTDLCHVLINSAEFIYIR